MSNPESVCTPLYKILPDHLRLLSVKNGIIELDTGNFREKTSDDKLLSHTLDIEWKGLDYPTPDIDKYINEVMCNNTILLDYLQKVMGYFITGLTTENRFLYICGGGASGKTTFMRLINEVLGKLCKTKTQSFIMNTQSYPYDDGDLSEYENVRLLCIDNFIGPDNRYGVNYTRIDDILGNSYIRGLGYNYSNQLHFMLTSKFPHIFPNGINKKMIFIPFLAWFYSGNEPDITKSRYLADRQIYSKLCKNLDQLLVWLVKGSIKYFKEGIHDIPVFDPFDPLNLKDKIKNLEEKVKDLQVQILYQPGGSGYNDAKKEFYETANA